MASDQPRKNKRPAFSNRKEGEEGEEGKKEGKQVITQLKPPSKKSSRLKQLLQGVVSHEKIVRKLKMMENGLF
jgi:hypothetical protein